MHYKIFSIIGGIAVLVGIGFFVMTQKQEVTVRQSVVEDDSLVVTGNPFTIIAFGDSLTAGYGVELSESYPSILETKLQEANFQAKVINMGVSGETTSMALERITFIKEQMPDVVLLGIGANDMLRALPPEEAKKNIETIIKSFQEAGIPVVLLGMKSVATNGSAYRESFDGLYPTLAKEYDIPLVPFFLEDVVLNPTRNISDGIHPNKVGYEIIVEKNILPVLLPYLKQNNF